MYIYEVILIYMFTFAMYIIYVMKTNRERFESVASKRVDKVVDSLRSLQKCSNLYSYEYNEADVKKMFLSLRNQMDELKMSFDKGLSKNKNKEKFKF